MNYKQKLLPTATRQPVNPIMATLFLLGLSFFPTFLLATSLTITTDVATCTGNADAVDPSSVGIVYNTGNSSAVLGGNDGNYAEVYDGGDRLVLDLSDIIRSGESYTIRWRRKTTYTDTQNADMAIEESTDGVTWVENSTRPATSSQTFINSTVVAGIDTRYLRIRELTVSGDDLDVDAISYTNVDCCTGSPSFATTTSSEGTCNGSTPNNDASVQITGIQDADRVGISSAGASTYDGAAYAGATTISGTTHTFGNLMHGANYIIRLFDGVDGCPIDETIITSDPPSTCPVLPSDLPWTGSECNGKDIILQSGIAILTCSVTEEIQPASERWTFGLVDMNNAIPATGRVDNTANQAMYHHPDWTVDKIGNVFGIAINEKTGNFYVTASSNYGAGFGVGVQQTGILQYGSIGGGANSLQAAGTVYKIDATTGVPTVFAVLPQQSTSFTAHDCENGTTQNRTTGVGLGNIVYDETNNQYFVTNIEDGRIYRLDADGSILDSFDPFTEDDGVAGISILEELPYGLAIEPNGNRLFFGAVDSPQAGANNAGAGNPGVYSINLAPTGGFIGTIDNSNNPSGATYDNFVGTETLHTTVSAGVNEAGNTFTTNTVYLISDLHFTPDNKLMVGVRVSCQNSFFASYNHWGETTVLTANALGVYNNNQGDYDISVTGDSGDDDNYGGVASYELQDGSGDIHYLVTSADILTEAAPHGVVIFDENASTTTQVTPLGAVSYGTVDTGDPKGVGGDVEVFSACVPKGILTASAQSQNCNFNDTPNDETDDYIVFNLTATNTSGGLSNQFEVVYNDVVLATGFYGSTVTIEYSDAAQTQRFAADGTSVYSFTIRDVDDFECYDFYNSTPVAECSDCPIEICLPVDMTIKRSE